MRKKITRCFTINRTKICEGDRIVQSKRGETVERTVKGIGGGYAIIDDTEGILALEIRPLKKILTGAKFEIVKRRK